MTPVEPLVVECGPVDKVFRPFQPDQLLLVPPSLDEWLPQEHLARFIADLVDEHLDLSGFYAGYQEGRGGPPFDPRLMVWVLLLGYTTGIRSSRKLEAACWDMVAFRWLAGGAGDREVPETAPVSVGACVRAGPGVVPGRWDAQPGPGRPGRHEVRANASRRKAMSYARMSEKQKVLAGQVSALLAEAEQIDHDEDAEFGRDNKGYGLPAELARRESRLAKITEAKAALEAQAKEQAAAQAQHRAKAAGKDEETVALRAAAAGDRAVPKPAAQRNFTDPESRIMKTADGSFHQCFNAQAVVDEDHQVIVATDLNNCAADSQSLVPMTEQISANTALVPKQLLADAGYCSQANLEAAGQITTGCGTQFLIATGRLEHDDPARATPSGRIPNGFTLRQ